MDFVSLLDLPVATALFYLSVYVPAFFAALVVIVFIHEYGHFQAARWCGVDVEAFSIGFGREIAGWYDRRGTRWKLCWIPLGGYVKFSGDANAASLPDAEELEAAKSDPGNFHGKPVWQRALVVAAGPIANFILAIFIFSSAFMLIGAPVSEPRVDEVLPGSAAEEAGVRPGDVVVSINGVVIEKFSDLQQYVFTRPDERLAVVIDRGGERLNLTVTPKVKEETDSLGGKVRIGLLGVKHNPEGGIRYERLGPVEAVKEGGERTWWIVEQTFRYLGKLVTGRESANQLGGPLAIAAAAGNAAMLGFSEFVVLVAFLSVSIGLINLFPIPMLDGGHLVYYAIEAVRGKPLGESAQEWGFRIGFSIVIMLMVFGTFNDVMKLAFGG